MSILVPYDTLETLESAGPSRSETIDRRRSTREPRNVPAWLSNASGRSVASSQQQVIVTNLSLHGVGFTASKQLEKDDAHWIVIANDRLSLSTRLRPDGGWDVGADFF
jgi:hypothetical protein